MGRKKVVSTAELLARGKKNFDQAAEESSWEDAAAMLAEEAAAQEVKQAAEKASARSNAAAETQSVDISGPEGSASAAKGKKKKKGKNDAAPVAAPAKSALDLKREEIQRKVRAAQKARAEETRSAFKKDSAADAAFVDEIMGSREQLAHERRRAKVGTAAATAALQSAELILVEAAPSASNQQHPDETLEEWHAVGETRGGFERSRLGFHPGVSCDRSGKLPIIGDRYQLAQRHLDPRIHPFGYDVCEEVWRGMPPKEQEMYDKIPPPLFACDASPLLQPLKRHFAYQSSGL